MNIILFHLVLAPGGLPVALFVVGCEGFLAFTLRSARAGLSQPPAAAAGSRVGQAVRR